MPILHLPGEMMPGQFGPISRVGLSRKIFFRLDHVERRNAFGDADDDRDARVGGFHDGVGGECGRNVDHRGIRTGFPDRVGNRVEDRNSLVRRAAFAGRDAADDIRSILDHLLRMEGSFFAGNTLHDQPRRFIN